MCNKSKHNCFLMITSNLLDSIDTVIKFIFAENFMHMNFRLKNAQYEFSDMKYKFSAPLSIRLVVAFVYIVYVVIYTFCPYYLINHHGAQA